jgi:hypothetical protein
MVVMIVAAPVVGQVLSGLIATSGTIPMQTNSGVQVNVAGASDMAGSDFPYDNTVDVKTDQGNITVSGNDPANVSIAASDITGTYTNATNLDVQDPVTLDPEDKEKIIVEGDIKYIAWKNTMQANDGTTDFKYGGSSGTSTVYLYNAPADTYLAAVDKNTNELLDANQSDSNGQVTFVMPNSDHEVVLQTTEGGPTVDNLQPEGALSESPDQLQADISDPDFPQDNVSVTFTLDGTEIHQEYVDSNTTVTTSNYSQPFDIGSTHDYTVEATDAFSQSDSQSASFSLPANVTIRNETKPTQIITGANVTVTFYGEDGETVETFNDSNDDGKIDMTGLPNVPFVATVDIEGYHDRRAYINKITQQQDIFLLNSTEYPIDNGSVFTEFALDDKTGNFPTDETVLEVQRSLNISGGDSKQWYTVAGDKFGATNRFPFTGEYQKRYRLVVENSQGDRRILGSYTPTVGGIQTVEIGQVEFSAEVEQGVAVQTSAYRFDGSEYLRIGVWTGDTDADEFEYRVVRSDNESHVIISNTTITLGEQSTMINRNLSALDPSAGDDQGYKIDWTVKKPADEDVSGTDYVGTLRIFDFDLDPTVLNLMGWVGLVAFAGITSLRSPTIAMIGTTVIAAGMTMIGILAVPNVLIMLAGTIAAFYLVGSKATG